MRGFLLLGLAIGLVGCPIPEEEPPGDVVGTFDVLGLVEEHTCGNDVILGTDGRIIADVWRDDRLAYWQTDQGSLVTGTIVDEEFRFRAPQTLTLTPAEPRFNVGACVVTRTDTLDFTLTELEPESDDSGDGSDSQTASLEAGEIADGGVAEPNTPMELRGTQAIEFAPVAGSDCRFAVVAGGGMFLTLPCRVEYALSGERIDL